MVDLHKTALDEISTRDEQEVGVVPTLAEGVLADLSLLRECAYFIGTFSSELSRLAYLLMLADRGRFVPYVSLDVPLFANDDLARLAFERGISVREAYPLLKAAGWDVERVL
eukprot:CAMPEP_0206220404 /NCGR_PEP_ID=MMETSP0047_2-20121206/4860_1 /ASSEMBLY_ACC=CAM_ASM_000192 /TAXON_ID=195065 /ORGANISM="Chroomonas mesostigmatica_cf, Strain CCMP1168" /LENGTH=111 /DNA_ID=CAMNT_0053643063 /DNA_START=3 /DNA_END=334 /DNA_ORIENTATION=-